MKIILIACASFLIFSCKKEVKEAEIQNETIVEETIVTTVDSHNSQNSLDWQGTYKGITPCADCEGIETEIVLNSDLTFVSKTKYLGKGDGKVFAETGSFVWDKTGKNIRLQVSVVRPSQYQVGENRLMQLNMEGKPITGDLAEKYVLIKK